MTSRKLHMRFRLAPRSMAFGKPWMLLVQIFSGLYVISQI